MNLSNNAEFIPQFFSSNRIEVQQLPSLECRKHIITAELLRYLPKTLSQKMSDCEQRSLQENPLMEQVCFSIPKQRIRGNKRVQITTKKVFGRQKNYETLELHENGKKMSDQKFENQFFIKQKNSFSTALKCIDHEVKPKQIYKQSKPFDRVNIYQPYKKKSSLNNNRDRLKPISSSSQMQNSDSLFLNVQKMVLLEGDRNKKSNSLIVKVFEERVGQNVGDRKVKNSKLIKDINIIKQKLNIQKILLNNDDIEYEEGNRLQNSLIVQHYESDKNERLAGRAINSAISSVIQQKDEINGLIYTQQRERQSEDNQNSNTVQGRKKSPNKLKMSPTRNFRRKFIVPFETYHYRDMLWKVNFSNSLYIQVPLEYEHRLKVFVGRGNNSCMVNGLIARRHWYAFTDRIEQANFAWTQTKNLSFYKKQQSTLCEQKHEQFQKGKYKQNCLLTDMDCKQIKQYFGVYLNSEQHNDERLMSRAKLFKYKKYVKSGEIKQIKMHNHLINNYVISNKKALFNTMANYYKEVGLQVFDYLPLTFHIKDGMEDKKYFEFIRYYHKRSREVAKNNEDKTKIKQYNAWIVKPGENSNRGNGIKMCLTLEDIKKELKQREKYSDGTYRTYIIQAYIQRPLLYYKRKFDLRHYMMITCVNGYVKGYWYKDGYVRTTSSQYSLIDNNGGIHLTNDAVQKFLPDYGKFQKGNKISYDQLASYITKFHGKKNKKFYESIYPKMKKIGTDSIRACSGGIDPSKLSNNFQIFGLDFMIDANLDVWLIEINTNPCLELSCPLLSSIIPKMVENALELTLDCMFPPPVRYCPKGVHYFKQLQKQNKFELVYDQRVERLYKGSLQVLDNKLLQQQDDTFEDCGDEWADS